jgi:tRNA pseudouridine-54 N-methylase
MRNEHQNRLRHEAITTVEDIYRLLTEGKPNVALKMAVEKQTNLEMRGATVEILDILADAEFILRDHDEPEDDMKNYLESYD